MAKIYSRLLPLPFYLSKDDKYSEQPYIKDTSVALLLCPKNTLIDFQIQRDSLPDVITEFKVFTKADVEELDLATTLIDLTTVTNGTVNFDVISYSSQELAAEDEMDCGVYYIYVTDGTLEWFSEDFRVIDYSKDFESEFNIGTFEPVGIQISAGNNLTL